MRLRLSPRLAWQKIDEEVVIVDLPAGRVCGLNPVASEIWPLLFDRDEDAVVRAVVARFGVEDRIARQDLRQFVAMLGERGYVTAA
jgi:hypothetical protein